jgi:hypothetical protein
MTKPLITTPAGLSPAMVKFYKETVKGFALEPHHLEMLKSVCRLLDRASQARTRVKEDGEFYLDRFNQPHLHPGIAMERESMLTASRILDRLGLDVDPPLPNGRPPGR